MQIVFDENEFHEFSKEFALKKNNVRYIISQNVKRIFAADVYHHHLHTLFYPI